MERVATGLKKQSGLRYNSFKRGEGKKSRAVKLFYSEGSLKRKS
jgi:hypothetical protein